MVTDRIEGRAGRTGRGRSARGLGLTAAAGVLLALGAFGTGCDEVIEEECFEQAGTLTQVTTDTLTVDHLYPALSPDGTRIVFMTDFFVAGAQEGDEKPFGQGDFAIIDVPAPGEERPPTASLETIGNARLVELDGDQPTFDEYGAQVDGSEALKGEVAWIDDDTIVGVMTNSRFLDRLFVWRVESGEGRNVYPVQPLSVIEADTLLERESEAVRRFQFYYRNPAVSPNGEWLAYSRYYFDPGPSLEEFDDRAEAPAIFAANLNDGRVIRVTNGSARENQPAWSPDGNSIAFVSLGDGGQPEIFRVGFDPSSPAAKRAPGEAFTDGRQRLTFTSSDLRIPESSFEPTWMRNGQIVFTSTRRAPCSPRRIRNIWIMGPDGDGVRPLIASEEDDARPMAVNSDGAPADVADLLVFTTRRNRDDAFIGQKEDLWVIRGGF